MGLTLDDCKRLNIPLHLHPAYSGRDDAFLRDHFEITLEPVRPKRAGSPDGMNKTERAFAETLGHGIFKGLFHRWAREPIKLRLAGRTWYTPDFGVWFPYPPSEPFTLIEVKGFMRDDAAVKLKVAASMYPEWRWLLVRREGRHGWRIQEVTSRGIEVDRVEVPWIIGD